MTHSKIKISLVFFTLGVILLLSIPIPDYTPMFSKALYSSEGELMSALVSKEEQWCFPIIEDIPQELKDCIVMFEDEYFHYHFGINPVSVWKAASINIKEKKIVRGASTITMQLMRMKNKNVKRNWKNKIWESLSAIKYTLLNSKNKTIEKWCEIAPYGSNIIGVRAASLHYFGRELDNLSWSEYALLAVIPNAPGLENINTNKLKGKRDFLLRKLYQKDCFSEQEYQLYIDENLPNTVHKLNQKAYHFLRYCSKNYPDIDIYKSTIEKEIQNKLNVILQKESSFLQMDDINNAAAVVFDIEKNTLLAYVGNVKSKKGQFRYVDILHSPRSYGSLLKPLLYLYALDYGYYLPHELVADIPTNIGNYRPENFDKKYRGAIPLEEMVIKSLNVPSVRVLNRVGLNGFYKEIEELEIANINKKAEHYGLSLILGGGESTLWDLSRIYKGFAQNYIGIKNPFQGIQFLEKMQVAKIEKEYGKLSLNYVIDAMADLERPREEKHWNIINESNKIAWKTGTSYGHKDAWAIGFNRKYLVGIWTGNEKGEGRYNLTGLSKAAPIMFKIFNSLPSHKWFDTSQNNDKYVTVCSESGKLASNLCSKTEKIYLSSISHKYSQCKNHEVIHLSKDGKRIPVNCNQTIYKSDTIFYLPPFLAYYYYKNNPRQKTSYQWDNSCNIITSSMELIYPNNGLKIFLPKESTNKQNQIIAKAYHNNKNEKVFWFLDENYLGVTKNQNHELLILPTVGSHNLKIIDSKGNNKEIKFEILE